jgi:predicted transcriptional regulator
MTVKLDPTMRQRLQALGAARQRSPHWLMVEAIRLYVEREEEEERENAIARERLARYDATGEYVDGDDMHAWAASLGTGRELSEPPVRKAKRPKR